MKRSAILSAVLVCFAMGTASYASSPHQPTNHDTGALGSAMQSSAEAFFPLASLQPESAWSFAHATMVTGAALEGAESAPGDGIRVSIDPVTGELRQPGADDAPFEALEEERVARSFVAPTEVQLPDGTVMMQLSPDLMNYSLAWSSELGAGFTCVDGHAHDESTVPAAPPAREEK